MANRKSIAADNIPTHPQPFPTATKVGNMVFSSAVAGGDPETHEVPDDPETQVKNAFAIVGNIMDAAGGSVDDIGKMVVYVRSRDIRPLVNPHWEKMFPDEASRPVRHTVPADLPANYQIQLEFIAVL